MSQKGFRNIIFVIVIICIIAIGGYFIFSKKSATPTRTQPQQTTQQTNQQVHTSDWKTYRTEAPDKTFLEMIHSFKFLK